MRMKRMKERRNSGEDDDEEEEENTKINRFVTLLQLFTHATYKYHRRT